MLPSHKTQLDGVHSIKPTEQASLDAAKLCPMLMLYALYNGDGIQQQSPSQLNQEKVTKGREGA